MVFLENQPLYRMPALLLAAIFLVLLLAAVELGFRAGMRSRRRREPQAGADFATIQGAVLGLLGLLLAFTYAFAASRADIRKQNVIEEANAIGTAWLRAGLAAEPMRTELRGALTDYLDTRVQSQSVRDASRMDDVVAVSEVAQARLWPCVERLLAARSPTVIDSLIVQSINEVIDMHTRRLAGFRDRVPEIILAMLALVGVASLGLAGFASGLVGRRNTFSARPYVCWSCL